VKLYPLPGLSPVVTGNAKDVPAGGSTKPIDTDNIAEVSKFAMTKSPGSCPDVFAANVGAVGAVTLGPADLVMVSEVVVVTPEAVTTMVIVLDPSERLTERPLPDEVDVPLTVIVALPLDAVGVTVIVESLDDADAE
jgi:hypothetical protein